MVVLVLLNGVEPTNLIKTWIDEACNLTYNEPELNNSKNDLKPILEQLKEAILVQSNFAVDDEDITTPLTINLKEKNNINGFDYSVERKNQDHKKGIVLTVILPIKKLSPFWFDSYTSLINDLLKVYNYSPKLCFIFNNSSEEDYTKVCDFRDKYVPFDNDIIIVNDPKIKLAQAISLAYLDQSHYNYNKLDILSFWDDEVIINSPPLSPVINNGFFNSNINKLFNYSGLKVVSGYMIDRRNLNFFHSLTQGNSYFSNLMTDLPRLHCGAGMVMRWTDFPKEGIWEDSIFDDRLAKYILSKYTYSKLKNADVWPVSANFECQAFHPAEENIVRWTTKYLMYTISWDNTNKLLEYENPRILSLWRERLKLQRDYVRDNVKLDLFPNYLRAVGYFFMQNYYTIINNVTDKENLYYDYFKKFRQRFLL